MLHVVVQIGTILRVFLRPHREPATRITWTAFVIALPFLGLIGYLLFGEVNIGRRRIARMHQVLAGMPDPAAIGLPDGRCNEAGVPAHLQHLFHAGRSINGFLPLGGNRGRLLADSNAAIDAIVADIDAARSHVHLSFYIWLADGNGLKVVEALKRASGRGVVCRAIADDLGSRALIGSPRWREMRATGVRLVRALPIGNPLLRVLKGRLDLRNHRKIVVIDNWIAYCGSQNCADPEFRVKARFAPWVDAVMRFEGPVARQLQYLFASDWTAGSGEDLREILCQPLPEDLPGPDDLPRPEAQAGAVCQAIGTGPTVRYSAMPEMFETLMFAARRELTITTPYYVPNEGIQAALCATARRGVATRLVVPAVNDSWIVGAASRSCYADLLNAGVRIFEYRGGLLHTKSLTLDGVVLLIGSANLDRRSFELNYENNVLVYDRALTAELSARQSGYIERSREVSAEDVARWSWRTRLRNNAVAILGPVL